MTTLNNFAYFTRHLSEYMKNHAGKFVVIAEEKEQGFFDTFDEAYRYAVEKFELGNFVVQQCVSEQENTATFYSPLYR